MADSTRLKETMRTEYDMRAGVRGKYVGRVQRNPVVVTLEPYIASAFPDADAVNEALRILMKAARKTAEKSAAAA